jgi:CrcB protein
MKIIFIGIFGVLGIYSRYFIDTIISNNQNSLPISTLVANSIGCFLAGVIYCFISQKYQSVYLQPLLIGFCGGLTTFSSYSLQTLNLLSAEQSLKSLTYLILSPTLGIIFVFIGLHLTLHLFFSQN